ncbi:Kelch repeat-containing protein [Sorangium sp. So ce513]|uniref:Kelch repeat-containing protein n=1 Tax=Sorangium sp. So ce513 TaxID=3133315 RepID=UPI003F5E924A
MTRVHFVLRGLPFSSFIIRITALLIGALFLSGLGCALDAAPPGGDELRFRFPGQAAQVLLGDEAFVAVDKGFALASTGGATREIEARFERRGGLKAVLPARGEGKVRFHLPGGFEIGVREIGAEGEGAVVEHAVAYRRQGGTSFWSAVDAGYEEWLHLDAGVANGGAPVAEWEVDGATLRQQGDAVEVVDDVGAARLRVTAPAAYASGGRPVEARLEVRGATIALWVDAGGEEVLVDPIWAPIGAMSAARANYTATPLGNGMVLVVGGTGASGALGSAELYDPVSNTWWPAGTLATARYNHTATLLGNGKVLVVGGNANASVVHTSAELYDPASNTWTATGALAAGRGRHTATLLGNGKVLVAGGSSASPPVAMATAELYDPSTGVWSPASSMGASRSMHTATLLGSGKVLVAGGNSTASAYLSSAELYDPGTGAWSPTASMTVPRSTATATLLVSGKVLVAGGYNISADYLQSVEIYDPSSSPPVWTTATPMSSKRGDHTATLLPNGKVLLTGGWSAPMVGSASAEVYDPGTNVWAGVGSISVVRIAHTATLLGNGKVLLAGGFNYGIPSTTYHSSAELYDPAATTWGSVASMSYARIAPTATLLNDGRVLVTGGDSLGMRTELYDPSTNTWAAGPLMAVGRQYHTATLLGNGKVLVVGVQSVASTANAQLFDPATDTWSSVGSTSPNLNRMGHTATLLPNGKVLVVGGVNPVSSPVDYLGSAALFNPVNNTWSTADDLFTAERAYHAATLLPNGRVLLSGGRSEWEVRHTGYGVYEPGDDEWLLPGQMVRSRAYHTLTLLLTGEVLAVGGGTVNTTVEVYNPTSNLWSAGTAVFYHRSHTATLLNDGKVLVAGGIYDGTGNVTRNAYIYDPATGNMDATGQMNDTRYAHAAVRLGNGKVLVVGGSNGSALSTAEIYTP